MLGILGEDRSFLRVELSCGWGCASRCWGNRCFLIRGAALESSVWHGYFKIYLPWIKNRKRLIAFLHTFADITKGFVLANSHSQQQIPLHWAPFLLLSLRMIHSCCDACRVPPSGKVRQALASCTVSNYVTDKPFLFVVAASLLFFMPTCFSFPVLSLCSELWGYISKGGWQRFLSHKQHY